MKPIISNIKYIVLGACIVSGIVLLYNSIHDKRPPHKPPPHTGNTITTSIVGAVDDYAANSSGDIDKIILNYSGRQLIVHFPPHTAKCVTGIAVKKSIVNVRVESNDEINPESSNRMELVSISAKDSSVTCSVAGIPPPPPGAGNQVEIKSDSIQLITNGKGDVNAFILSGKLIALPPHVRDNLVPLIKNGRRINIKGIERDTADGFVNIRGLNVIKPFDITIDGIHYLVQ